MNPVLQCHAPIYSLSHSWGSTSIGPHWGTANSEMQFLWCSVMKFLFRTWYTCEEFNITDSRGATQWPVIVHRPAACPLVALFCTTPAGGRDCTMRSLGATEYDRLIYAFNKLVL